MTKRTLICILAILTWCSTSFAQSYGKQDAAIGGLAGAVLGGIIGHQNDETPEGALIGGAVGAIAGGLLGKAKDQQIQQHRAYQHHAWNARQAQLGRAVTINDVVEMSRSGVSEGVILNQVRTNGVADHIGTHQIIAMHNSGVSERVITAMQQTPRAGTAQPVRRETVVVESVPPPRPVIVHREIHVSPRPMYVPHHRVRYATRPAFPTYPSRRGFHHYW